MPVRSNKYEKYKDTSVLSTHDVGVSLPMNTKYLSGNPISRFLLRRFLGTVISVISSNSLPLNKILDVGCGEGIISRQLYSLWPSAILHGLDISTELLEVAQKLVPVIGCFAGSIYAIPLPDETYELVCCTEVLEHLEQPECAISEIMRVGKGNFLFSVPNEPWWRIANMIRGVYWPEWGNTPGHINHWSTKEFVRFLSNFSEVIAVKRAFPWTIVLCRKK